MFGDRMLRQETLKPKSVGATLSRFSSYFRPYWWVLIIVAVLMTVNAYSQVNRTESDRPGRGLLPRAGGDQ